MYFSVQRNGWRVIEYLWSIKYPICRWEQYKLTLCDLPRLNNVSHTSLFSIEMSEFLLITGHGHQILTPNTPSSHRPGEESRRDLTDFYKQVYVPKLEPFVKQFQPLAGVSRYAQNSEWNLRILTLFVGFSDVCVAVRWKLLLCLHTRNSQSQLFVDKDYPRVYTCPLVTRTPQAHGLLQSPTHSPQSTVRSVNTPLRLCFRSVFSLLFSPYKCCFCFPTVSEKHE